MERYVYVDDSGVRQSVTEDVIRTNVLRGVCGPDTIIEEYGEKKRLGQFAWLYPDGDPAKQAPNKSS